MKKVSLLIGVCCCMGLVSFAGDTNFVTSFKTMWQTHNASNILNFAEQSVITNATSEAFFARGIVAIMLQSWRGATNYFEQSIQIISTNNAYSQTGRTNIIKEIQWVRGSVESITDGLQPLWNTNRHALFFSELAAEPIFFDILQEISTMPTVENQ